MKKNGFKAMFERMSNPNPKVMLLSMKLFLRIVVKVCVYSLCISFNTI
jgi:hypothetical protein